MGNFCLSVTFELYFVDLRLLIRGFSIGLVYCYISIFLVWLQEIGYVLLWTLRMRDMYNAYPYGCQRVYCSIVCFAQIVADGPRSSMK